MPIHSERQVSMIQPVALASVILCILVCMTPAATVTEWQGDLSVYELASFANPDVLNSTETRKSILNHFALTDDNVYVGGVNWLYRLDGQLNQVQNIRTCEPPDRPQCRLNSNHNKILVVYESELVTCGSEFNGNCQFRKSDNIADVTSMSEEKVAGYRETTTVSLIAPNQGMDYLYVAVTYTDEVDIAFIPPPLSRRNLELKGLTVKGDDKLAFFTTANISPIDIKYVEAFSYDGFTYFVTSQPEDSGSSVYVSKINRVCHEYMNLDSYTEITIECRGRGSGGSVYSLVQAAHLGPAGHDLATSLGLNADDMLLYAVFAKNQGVAGSSDVPMNESALCVYKMTDILDAFKEAVRDCIQKGGGEYSAYSASYLYGSLCAGLGISPDNFLCNPVADGSNQLYIHAKGITQFTSTAVLEEADILMSSIITSIEVNHTVAFIGTSSGQLLKVHIEGRTSARVYERVALDTSPVLRDVQINNTTRIMHVLTEQKLIKMRAENCNQYTTCETCIGTDAGTDGDPYCGWCTLERMCTRYSECPYPDVSTRWLAYNAAQCIEITNVAPYNSLPITVTQQQMTLTVQQLPDLAVGKSYECHFGEYVSSADKTGDMLRCISPPAGGIPPIQQGDAVTVTLSVYSNETSVEFIDTEFHFYECSLHTSCVSCVGSRWLCDWCVFENRCTHDSSTCSGENEIIVTGEKNPDNGQLKGPGFCPQLVNQTAEVFIPNGIARGITARTTNLPSASPGQSFRYVCALDVEGKREDVNAVRNEDFITCDGRSYSYAANASQLVARLTVEWIDNLMVTHALDDIHGFDVTLYKCEVRGPDCSRCVTARADLNCVWCGTICKLNDSCTNPPENNQIVTPHNGLNCPNPELLQVYPLTGPMEGNTIIAITGTDIGRRFQDVTEVKVGGQPCDLQGLESEYEIGESVSCRTGPRPVSSQQVSLIVRGEDNSSQPSSGDVVFAYTNPSIDDFQPIVGPAAGGTAVNITGQSLDTGRQIVAFIGDAPCHISSSRTETEVECTSDPGMVGQEGAITLSFDGANRTSSKMYTYTENPTITDVSPLTSIESGGRELTVKGTYLNTCQTRQIVVNAGEGTSKYDDCYGSEAHTMICPSPNILASNALAAMVTTNTNRTFGFVMDGVQSLLLWSEMNNVNLIYAQDPKYVEFTDGEMDKDGSTLTIMGERIDSAITMVEIEVWIGPKECIVTFIDDTSVLCTLPEEEPAAGDYLGNDTDRGLPVVWVIHNNVKARIGYIKYPGVFLIPILVAAVSGAILIGIVVVVSCFMSQVYGAKREVKVIQEDMVALEASLASEVRQAFVELQTDMTDLTSDLEGIGMPFVSHREYATNMLFIGQETVPNTEDEEFPSEQMERAMGKFSQLLSNKNFLLIFIQTLDAESSSKLSIREKQSVASLLAVVMILENKLVYLTDVLVTLMTRVIEDAADSNRTRQLFCRTESILEKLMSNWVALCLYDQLKHHTAYPLFVLYRAIKYRSESGPIDVMTGRSRFSLNYDKLLQEDVDYESLTLVVHEGRTVKKEVKVLDVDTISQVKGKILDAIHRNSPYSSRPSANQVDLEWRQGRSGKLVLTDTDLRPLTDKWRRINMLKDFQVPDRAHMRVVTKEEEVDVKGSEPFLQFDEGATYENPGFTEEKQSTNQQVGISQVESQDGIKDWHLTQEEETGEDDDEPKRQKKGCLEIVNSRNKINRRRIKEISFPRLLSSKGIVQEYVDKMFAAILSSETAPRAIKYLFDFFDSQAFRHDLSSKDPDLLHIWKSNILPLRFWANAIKHPNYIFDIRPSRTVEASLDVIGQLFHDSHDTKTHKLGRDASVNKLLYSREKMKYSTLVDSFYHEVEELPSVPKQELNKELHRICDNFTGLFSKLSTLDQLWKIVRRFKQKLLDVIDDNERCKEENLDGMLEEIENILSEEPEDAV